MTNRIRLLDELGGEFSRVAAEREVDSRGRTRGLASWVRATSRVRTLSVAVGLTALLAGTAYAVPTTRAAVDSVTSSLTGWIGGGDDAPGRTIDASDNAPRWIAESASDDERLIAETAGVGLYVQKSASEMGVVLDFALGPGISVRNTVEGWRRVFDQHSVAILGDAHFGDERGALDDRGRAPLFGVSGPDVTRVEVRYVDGPPGVGEVGDGGFVLLVDAWRPMSELLAYDRAGEVLERVDLRSRNMRWLCTTEPGCPPDVE